MSSIIHVNVWKHISNSIHEVSWFFRNRDWTPIPCLQVPLEELLDDLMAMTLDAREGGTTGEDTQSGAEGRHSEMDMA